MDWTTTIWQDIELTLPAAWEMTQYGSRYQGGAATFTDEFENRFHLAWQRQQDRPDLRRIFSDMQAAETLKNVTEEDPAKHIQAQPMPEPAGWAGLVLKQDGRTTLRAARYFNNEETLLELTLFWTGKRRKTHEQQILQSVHVHKPDTWRRWHAFGICAEVPVETELNECRCLPGDTQWHFAHPKGLPGVRIRRMAFPDIWLRTSLARWLRTQIPDRSHIENHATLATPARHPLEFLHSSRPDGRLGRLTGKRLHQYDFACLCNREQRVYHVRIEATTPPHPSQLIRLRCECGTLLPLENMTDAATPDA